MGIKCVFKNQDLKIFGLKLNKCEQLNLLTAKLFNLNFR